MWLLLLREETYCTFSHGSSVFVHAKEFIASFPPVISQFQEDAVSNDNSQLTKVKEIFLSESCWHLSACKKFLKPDSGAKYL